MGTKIAGLHCYKFYKALTTQKTHQKIAHENKMGRLMDTVKNCYRVQSTNKQCTL